VEQTQTAKKLDKGLSDQLQKNEQKKRELQNGLQKKKQQ
jgi:hypothetical protein